MANAEKTCPERRYLEKFVLGQLSVVEIEDCQQHLSNCDPCVETVQSLKIDDTFTGIARQAWQSELIDSTDDRQAIDEMIQRVSEWKRDQPAAEDRFDHEALTNRSAEVDRLLREPIETGDMGALAHYRILELLGTGSTGVVYLALDTKLDRQVVLKVLRPSLGEPARKRFVAEGRATAKLDHQNIVTIYEVGSDGPLSYLAMQWLPGCTLDEKLRQEESLTVENAKALAKQIAAGLAAAHERDLIHRDIKPANIWIPNGADPAKILDFGLVRIADEDPQLTCTGMIAGTPCFMSPEQSRGDSIDQRSDLFSLGCVMYQCLTSRLPFRSDNALATLRSIQQDQPNEPTELDPAIDKPISDLVMCLLEKSPNRRPPNAKAVIKALDSDQSDWEFEYHAHIETKSKLKRTRFGFWKSIAVLIFGIALGALGLSYGQQIIRIVTNQGEIVIDTKVDDVKIEIIEDGDVVKVVDLATQQSIEMESGQYQIRPIGDNNSVRIENGDLVLSRGETEIVRITRNTTESGTLPAIGSKKVTSRFLVNDLDPDDLVRKVKNELDNDVRSQTEFTTDPESLAILVATTAENANVVFSTMREIIRRDDGPYRLRRGDILGVFIDGLVGNFDSELPVHYPTDGGPPAVGYPMVVEHGGKISIPILGDIEVGMLTISEARKKFIDACTTGEKPLLRQNARIMLNLIRRADEPVFDPRFRNQKFSVVPQPTIDSQMNQVPDPELANVSENLPDEAVDPYEPNELPALPPANATMAEPDKPEEYKKSTTRIVEPTDSPKAFDPYSIYTSRKEFQKAIEKAENKVQQLKQSTANVLDIVQAKIELNQIKANRFDNRDPEPLRQLMKLREQQLKVIDSKLSTVGPDESSTLIEQRKRIRYELGNACKALFRFETNNDIKPYTQPVYEDQIYEHWYQIAQNERQLEKLNKAVLSIANLADQNNRMEMLETVLDVARRGAGVASDEQSAEFENTIRKVFEMQDATTFANIFLSELQLKDRTTPCFMVSELYAEILANKFKTNPDRFKDLGRQLIDELANYTEEYGDTESAFHFFYHLTRFWSAWGLSDGDSAKKLTQFYFDNHLSNLEVYQRVPNRRQSPLNEITYYRFIAKRMPETKGLIPLVVSDLKVASEKMEEQRREGGHDGADIFAQQISYVIRGIPDDMKPKKELVQWINTELNYCFEHRHDVTRRHGYRTKVVGNMVQALGITVPEFERAFSQTINRSEKSLSLRLIDGQVKMEVKSD